MGAGQRSTDQVVRTGSGMCPFFSPRGVRGRQPCIIGVTGAGVTRLNVHALVALHLDVGYRVQSRGWRGPWWPEQDACHDAAIHIGLS